MYFCRVPTDKSFTQSGTDSGVNNAAASQSSYNNMYPGQTPANAAQNEDYNSSYYSNQRAHTSTVDSGPVQSVQQPPVSSGEIIDNADIKVSFS